MPQRKEQSHSKYLFSSTTGKSIALVSHTLLGTVTASVADVTPRSFYLTESLDRLVPEASGANLGRQAVSLDRRMIVAAS